MDEWEQYEPHHRARMAFRPGLTGLWQVSGRSNITDFEEVVKLDDIAKCVSEGYTVTYSCIQMAVYMGYSEIYILGCDHNYSATFRLDGSIKKDSEVNQNYMTLIDHKLINLPRLDKTTLAYQRARIECEKRGVKIFNSTRGGKLEVFERKEFDSLF